MAIEGTEGRRREDLKAPCLRREEMDTASTYMSECFGIFIFNIHIISIRSN